VKKWYPSIFLAFVVAIGSVIISLILPNYSFLSPNPANAQQVDVRNGYVWLKLPSTGNQDDGWSCGPNSAARVLAFYGNRVDYGTVRSVAQQDHGIIPTKICIGSGFLKTCANTSRFKTGLEPSEIRDVMNRWEGGNTKYVSGADLDQLKSLLSQGKPVLVLWRVGSFKPGKIFGTWPEMHWVAVHGFNDQEQKIYYTDTNGETYQKTYNEFLSEWDWRIGDGLASETFYQKGIRPKTMIWVDRTLSVASSPTASSPVTPQTKPADKYLVGDWDGDRKDNLAVRRGNTVLMDFNFDGAHDREQAYGNGNSEDQYLVGDWDGDGKDNLAVRRGNKVLMDFNFDGAHDREQAYGNGSSEDQYLIGDWDGAGKDNLAVRRGNCILMDFNFDGAHDREQCYGNGNSENQYLVGDWDGDGKDNLAVRRGNKVLMDFNFDGAHDREQAYGNG
jgi:uncharacterized protein YvpB